MNQKTTNHKGILLWVDDNFIERPFEKDVVEWERIFGNESDHIYRLMNLRLKFATTYDSGKEAINQLADQAKQGIYVFCIIDLNLPKNLKTNHPISKYGMSLAQLAMTKEFNCVFLTTASIKSKEKLIEKGLATIPFYSKDQDEHVVPGPLVQHILSNFRTHINWISIEEIYNALNKEFSLFDDTFKNNIENLAIKYFPFENVFRAFVERWEYLPIPEKRTITIFRSPRNHSDAFIQQCLLVTLNNLVQNRPGYVSFKYTNTAFPQYSSHLQYAPNGLTVNAVRIDTKKTKTQEFVTLLEDAKASNANHITYFVIPNDESSDEYIEKAKRFRNINYEDLPTIRLGDSIVRQSIIRSAVNLAFQQVEILSGERQKKRLADIYLVYPEILIKPLAWVMNQEADEVAAKLSDPFEILNEIERSVKKLQGDRLSPQTRQKLINGEPVEISNLLVFGSDILENDKDIDFERNLQKDWLPKALKMWLSKSWQFPYGMDKKIIQEQIRKNSTALELETQWEEFSLSVLIDLVGNYELEEGSDELNAVWGFLRHEVIRELLNENEIEDEKWSELLTVKWPHYQYPMPVALSKQLKKAGRYLWVETNHFSLTRVFPSTRLRHRHLDDVVILVGQQLEWVEAQCEHLPYEWAIYIKKIIRLILNDQIKRHWKNGEMREALYKDLINFLNNALPFSALAHSVFQGHFSSKKEVEKFYKKFSETTTFGPFVGIIRGSRNKDLFTHIRPTEHWFSPSRNQTYNFFHHFSMAKNDYCRRITTDNIIEELKKDRLLKRLYEQMSLVEQRQLSEIIGTENFLKSKKDLKNLTFSTKKRLLDFLRGRKELETVQTSCERYDITEMVEEFIKLILNSNDMDSDNKGKYPLTKILDEISKINTQVSGMFKNTNSCLEFFEKNPLSTFFSSAFDAFEQSLNAYEKLSMTLQRLNYIDGYHFFNVMVWLRNNLKGAPPESDLEIVESAFELFSFGIEGLIAQLKFLLGLAGKSQLAENIQLKYVEEIKMPSHLEKPKPEDLKRFFDVGKNPEGDGYSVYHLGISGKHAKDKLGIMMANKFFGINTNKG